MIDAAKDFATLQAFIRGRLPEDERRAFEDRLVREPALVNELEQSLRMREGLGQLRARGYFNAAPQRTRFPPGYPPWPRPPASSLHYSCGFPARPRQHPLLVASLESRAAEDATSLVTAHFTFVVDARQLRAGARPAGRGTHRVSRSTDH